MARYYLFRSEADPQWGAYSSEKRGTKLSSDLAPWTLSDQSVKSEDLSAMPDERERIMRVIETDGYYLIRLLPIDS